MNRLTKHWITTVIGVLTFVLAGLLLWFEKGSPWVAVSLIPLSFILIRSKDSIIEKLTFGVFKINHDERKAKFK